MTPFERTYNGRAMRSIKRILDQCRNTPEAPEPEILTAYEQKPGMAKWSAIWLAVVFALCLMASCDKAHAQMIEGYPINTWAEAIHHAEGNDNYGVLTRFKHTSPKQACINTINHKYRLWVKKGRPGAFLTALGASYCPVGCSNDNGTNKYWIKNVRYWLRRIG